MKVLNNQKGFTLIELVIVIVVLGILAAVAIPQYLNLKSDAQAASNLGYVGGLRSAMAISTAASVMSKGPCIANIMSGVAPTPAQVQACVTGTLPSSLTVLGTGWTGMAPAAPTGSVGVVTWNIVAATATLPSTITCTDTGATAPHQC